MTNQQTARIAKKNKKVLPLGATHGDSGQDENNRPGGRTSDFDSTNELPTETMFQTASKAPGVLKSVQKSAFTSNELIQACQAFPMLSTVIVYLAELSSYGDAGAHQEAAEELERLAARLIFTKVEIDGNE